jgi:hypothetical protein
MKTKLFAAAAFAAMSLGAAAANAGIATCSGGSCTDGVVTINVTSVAEADLASGGKGVFTPGLMPSGFTMIDNFDTVNPAHGFTVTGNNIFPGGVGGAAAPPDDKTSYESVQPGASNAFTITDDDGRLTAISFYMGSPDDGSDFFNQLDLTVNGGDTISLQGGNIWGGSPGGGDQTKGFLITYTFSPVGTAVKTLAFSQVGSPAFEFDNLSGITVPEPASWALMIGGFGLAGASLRAKRRLAATA